MTQEKTSSLKVRNRQFGNGVSTADLLSDLNAVAEMLFRARAETRPISTSLTDAAEGYIARIGPISCMPQAIQEKTKALAKLYQDWDRLTGDLANGLEILARDAKRAPQDPLCSRSDKTAGEYRYDRRTPT